MIPLQAFRKLTIKARFEHGCHPSLRISLGVVADECVRNGFLVRLECPGPMSDRKGIASARFDCTSLKHFAATAPILRRCPSLRVAIDRRGNKCRLSLRACERIGRTTAHGKYDGPSGPSMGDRDGLERPSYDFFTSSPRKNAAFAERKATTRQLLMRRS